MLQHWSISYDFVTYLSIFMIPVDEKKNVGREKIIQIKRN